MGTNGSQKSAQLRTKTGPKKLRAQKSAQLRTKSKLKAQLLVVSC